MSGGGSGADADGPIVLAAGPLHAEVVAALHVESGLDRPWSAEEVRTLLSTPGAFGFIAEVDGRPGGFLLARAAGGEAEILMLAVLPGSRRRGLGGSLLEAGCRRARDLGALSCFLEVAADNRAALSLYRRSGFAQTAVRPGYYGRAEGPPADALLMRKNLAAARDQ